MRLTQIKLAGFKSFVDPTYIPIPGQLVGIVGPNGCGKSNIIDAVRWVLGESQARHLRGETMQDVIFNGSGERAPVSRASVELIFDNSRGQAAGQWSIYAEISIKRVLTRNGESSYYINNTHVRRRDVTDIFLGTGLGPRAYAIIEQGMISRVIEARPEELRVFLEEAAGASKYRERRKETELRLKDTRENLLRIADVRQELEKQLQHLEEQARLAVQYRELQNQLHTSQNLLWLIKKQDATASRNRVEKEIQKLGNELEADTAKLREVENRLEQVRTRHYSAGDAVHQAQGELYSANSEVSRLEQQIQHIRENRQRIESQLASLRQQLEQLEDHKQSTRQTLMQLQSERVRLQQLIEEAERKAGAEARLLPEVEQAFRNCQERVLGLQRELAQAQQSAQIEETHRAHAQKMLQQLEIRRLRLLEERETLPKTDQTELQRLKLEQAQAAQALKEKQLKLDSLQQRQPELEQKKEALNHKLQTREQALAGFMARLDTLKQLQLRLQTDGKLQPWLAKHHLEEVRRLWRELRIEQGWENALESVLRERLSALGLNKTAGLQDLLNDAPPVKLTVFVLPQQGASVAMVGDLKPLLNLVTFNNPGIRALLEDWLHNVYCADDEPLKQRELLPPGALLVSREGHIFTRNSVSFHAADSEMHGVLARSREIEQLEAEAGSQRSLLEEQRAALEGVQQQWQSLQAETAALRSETEALQAQLHQAQIAALKFTQNAEQVQRRAEQIAAELEEICPQLEHETQQQQTAGDNFASSRSQVAALQEHLHDAGAEHGAAETRLNEQREQLNQAQRSLHESRFLERENINRINEINNSIKVLDEQACGLSKTLEQGNVEHRNLDETLYQEQLQRALQAKQLKEQALAAARNTLEEFTTGLQQTEEERLTTERQLEPLRNRIHEMQLKEQEARLNEEQHAEQLRTAAADEEQLAALLRKGTKAAALQVEIARLNEEITALGAVNLAALEELQSAKERKNYLDNQVKDLDEAVETLGNAIRRIDRETRARLLETFEAVNRHLSEMFPMLFGGGQARLVLSGEEILDSGVQIIAQPPGKKTSSIHLLSGGEKALVALALVFSLFQLNPSPFCLLDEVDAPLDDTNTESFCNLVRKMSEQIQFLFISHNKITMEIAHQLIGITMPEQGVSRVVAVDIEEAMKLREEAVA
ncbi:MAG TPA: chromosome segregation protein SMC [Burkholderiales bacterium]|nr:chromosome segregation protein SMC [Burkholderiales bacterium]